MPILLLASLAIICPLAAIAIGLSDNPITGMRNYFLFGTLAMWALTAWIATVGNIADVAICFVLSLALLAVYVHLQRFVKEESKTSSEA